MATETEILALWKNSPKDQDKEQKIIHFYKFAQEAGRKEGLAALEREIVTDATIESAIRTFGWGRGSRASVITTRAIVREAVRIASEKVR